jgi:hypothetical protein
MSLPRVPYFSNVCLCAQKTSFLLFLNKFDIFEKKINQVSSDFHRKSCVKGSCHDNLRVKKRITPMFATTSMNYSFSVCMLLPSSRGGLFLTTVTRTIWSLRYDHLSPHNGCVDHIADNTSMAWWRMEPTHKNPFKVRFLLRSWVPATRGTYTWGIVFVVYFRHNKCSPKPQSPSTSSTSLLHMVNSPLDVFSCSCGTIVELQFQDPGRKMRRQTLQHYNLKATTLIITLIPSRVQELNQWYSAI